MNERDRQRIDVSCDVIAQKVDMNILWKKLLENRVFNFDDCNIPTWEKNFNNFETKKEIIFCIKTRGPYAFKNLLSSLEQCGYGNLATNLSQLEIDSNVQSQERKNSGGMSRSVIEYSESDSEDEYEDEEDEENEPPSRMVYEKKTVEIVLKKSTSFRDAAIKRKYDIERYIMRSKPRGLVLIVCITEYKILKSRGSAEHDRTNLQKLFEEMGFEVTVTPEYLERDDLRKIVKEFAERKDFCQVDSCFVLFSCHGNVAGKNWDAEIETSEHYSKFPPEKRIYCSDIVEYFSSTNCPLLKEKPKVFMFQMCRGTKHQSAVSRYETDGATVIVESDFENEVPTKHVQLQRNYENTLIAHSTVPDHYSYRGEITGSWFYQGLCKIFMEEAHHKHLVDLLHRVDKYIQDLRTDHQMCQTVVVTNMGFNNHCFLNPGYFGDKQ